MELMMRRYLPCLRIVMVRRYLPRPAARSRGTKQQRPRVPARGRCGNAMPERQL